MSLKSIFCNPFKARLKAYNSKLDWADSSCSDCIAFLNVYQVSLLLFNDQYSHERVLIEEIFYQVWSANHLRGYFKRSKEDSELSWARRHFVQLRILKEVKLLVDEILLRLKENNIEEPVGHGKVQWSEHQKALVLKVCKLSS